MIITNNTSASEIVIKNMKLDGTDIVVATSVVIDNSLLVLNAGSLIQLLFGSKISVLESPSNISTGITVELVDTAVTLTASDLVSGVIYTAVPTADRAQTTPTAVQIVAAIPNCKIGNTFEFTIVNTAAFNETLTAGVGVTILGNAVTNNASNTYKGLVTSLTAVTIFCY